MGRKKVERTVEWQQKVLAKKVQESVQNRIEKIKFEALVKRGIIRSG
jgi:hypothetical protein